ncbi:MAG TPA: transglycosylase domain-containing protein [Xanthobacteraceae bacterium]|nr:transglycosylase domain-containing protein [Xanthobacteraceae bacterium]
MAGRSRSDGGALWRLVRVCVVLVVILLAVPYLLAPFYRTIDPVSTLMLWRSITGARVERNWVPIDRIAPVLGLAVISAEDARFCVHHGVDFSQLREVVRGIDEFDDLADARGGSTITQQLAKNLFLWQGRSFVRKILEFPLALWLDLVLPKRRQLEIYLNIVEWGPNGEFGAQAAARRAFNKPARDLNAREAALLAAVLPNPHRRDARAPTPSLARLAGIYQGRMAASPTLDACVRARRGP